MQKARGLIVIDGSDGTGKTTLAQHFVKRHGAVHMHQTYRFKKQMFAFHTARLLKALKLAQSQIVVMDRLWMSEDIYAQVYRKGTPWPHEGRMIDRVLLKHAALQIVTTEDPETYEKTFARMASERFEMWHGNPAGIAAGYYSLYHGQEIEEPRTYADHLRQIGGMCKRHDVMNYTIAEHGSDLDDFTDTAIMALGALSAGQYSPCLDVNYMNVLGYAGTAEVIFAGDVANSKSRHINWPFYDYGHCSLFVAEAMHSVGFDETKALWTNTDAHEGVIHIADLLRIGPAKTVVAMGRNASKRLSDAGIKHAYVPHPAFAKRFMRMKAEDYGEELERSIMTSMLTSATGS